MKVYSIGREAGCDIVISDGTDVVSRRHAILSVTSSGKMTIVDQSHNGTYVNGIRIAPNVPVPVTRKDNISFAHIARLDWNLVPKSNMWLYIAIAVVAVLIIAGGVFGIVKFTGNSTGSTPAPSTTIVPDTTTNKEVEKEGNKEIKDEKKEDKKDEKKEEEKKIEKDKKKEEKKEKIEEKKREEEKKKEEEKKRKEEDEKKNSARFRG